MRDLTLCLARPDGSDFDKRKALYVQAQEQCQTAIFPYHVTKLYALN